MSTNQPTSPARKLISELGPNQYLDAIFMVNNCQLGQTRAGKPFLKCLLSDRSGRLAGRMWNCNQELFDGLPTDGFVWIEGQTQPYQGEIQVIIQNIKAMQPSALDLEDLLPCTKFDVQEMYSELTERLNSIEHQALFTLTQAYLADDNLMELFRRAPAAQMLHHAYLGGLLEHTLNMLRLADTICPLYPAVSRDIVAAGCFLHDLGKCVELSWDTGFGYTEDGNLVGHIARGVIWLEEKAKECAAMGQEIPPSMLRVLQHIVLSHHGRAEYGALKVPSTPEAILIHYIDNIDAKMNISLAATRELNERDASLENPFTEKIWSLETRLFKPDVTTD